MAEQKPVVSAAATKPAETKKEVPTVKVRSRGRISQSLEFLAKSYEAKHEGKKEVRWVYSPLHKPELSNVVGRRMDGWKPIVGADLPEAMELLGIKEDGEVRSGDVVLMWIDPATRRELRQEVVDRANEQAEAIERTHYDAIAAVRSPGQREDQELMKARGRSKVEQREHEFEYTQKGQEE